MTANIWQKNNEFENIMYMQGLFDGLIFSKFIVRDTTISTKLSIPQYVSATNTLYRDYRNSLIPVPFLLRIITLEIEGANKAK